MKSNQKNSINKRIVQKLPLLDDFLLFLTTNNYSNHTISNYERDLMQFSHFLEENQLRFEQVTKKLLDHYKADLIAQERQTLTLHKKANHLQAKSINRMLTSIRSYISFLIDRDEIGQKS
jgi:site-specific recombinase XerD